ncbi:MAG: hypothetical protein ACTS4U_01400 [Candidatus Hodgkinia cicadicola]
MEMLAITWYSAFSKIKVMLSLFGIIWVVNAIKRESLQLIEGFCLVLMFGRRVLGNWMKLAGKWETKYTNDLIALCGGRLQRR